MNSDNRFSHDPDTLKSLAADVLRTATRLGATAAEVDVSEGFGQAVTVRRGEIETIEYNRDKSIGVTVYIGQRRGNAASSDFSPKALEDTIHAALGRMDRGTFGRCLSCGVAIPIERLRVQPYAAFCHVCQARSETHAAHGPIAP